MRLTNRCSFLPKRGKEYLFLLSKLSFTLTRRIRSSKPASNPCGGFSTQQQGRRVAVVLDLRSPSSLETAASALDTAASGGRVLLALFLFDPGRLLTPGWTALLR
ncbi:unnamed protein product [Victoria cruziana]